jgi:hypothetical protein
MWKTISTFPYRPTRELIGGRAVTEGLERAVIVKVGVAIQGRIQCHAVAESSE